MQITDTRRTGEKTSEGRGDYFWPQASGDAFSHRESCIHGRYETPSATWGSRDESGSRPMGPEDKMQRALD